MSFGTERYLRDGPTYLLNDITEDIRCPSTDISELCEISFAGASDG